MAGVSFTSHSGKNILIVDVSELKVQNREEIKRIIGHAKEQIQKHPLKSLLIITDVTNTHFDNDIVETFKEYAKHNNPYIKASAVVGLSGMQKVILLAIKKFTGRDFYIASNLKDAEEWLVQQ
jgi:trimethylamine:corrinoid methyltransferase-like protein